MDNGLKRSRPYQITYERPGIEIAVKMAGSVAQMDLLAAMAAFTALLRNEDAPTEDQNMGPTCLKAATWGQCAVICDICRRRFNDQMAAAQARWLKERESAGSLPNTQPLYPHRMEERRE